MTRWLLVTVAAITAAVIPTMAFNLIVAHTANGHTYKVNQQHARQLIGLVNDLEHTFGPIPYIGCYARFGHVAMSQHHIGNACDFAQSGWGRTSYRGMYTREASMLIRKWGLRNGCSFGDCGHVDAGGPGWVNGAPAGQIARAEIPATGMDTSRVNVATSGEWPTTLPRKDTATYQVASVESHPYHRHHHHHVQQVAAHESSKVRKVQAVDLADLYRAKGRHLVTVSLDEVFSQPHHRQARDGGIVPVVEHMPGPPTYRRTVQPGRWIYTQ